MTLHEFFSLPHAPSVKWLADALNVSVAQVRQWVHGYAGRRPSPSNCVQIERLLHKQVTRIDLRPDDWRDIWPELAEAQDVAHG